MASPKSQKTESGEFWAPPAAKSPASTKPPMAKWKKITLILGTTTVVLIAGALLVAPSIAGSMVPGMVEKAAGEKITGKLHIGSASLSWFGTQKIGPIIVLDPTKPDGKNEILRADVECDTGLLRLAKGALGSGPNLGTIRVTGKGDLARALDGTTNLERALAPKPTGAPASTNAPPPSPSRPAQLPKSLQGRIIVEKFDLNYTDEAQPAAAVQIKDLSIDALLSESGPSGARAFVKLLAKAVTPQGPQGQIKADVKVDSFTDSSGTVTIGTARADATVQADNLPLALVDALTHMNGKLTSGLGPTLKLDLTAKGTLKSADAALKAVAQGLNADASVNIADNLLTSSGPIAVNLTGNAVRALAELDKVLAQTGTLTLAQTPDVAVMVDALKVKIPTAGAALDLRGSSANLTVKTSKASGTVKLQPEPNAAPTAFDIAPLELVVAVPDFAGPITVKGNTVANVGGQPAGTLAINLKVAGILDQAGKPIGGIPASLEGSANLTGVATAIAQPFVAGKNIDLPNDVGPTLDLQLSASTASTPGTLGTVNIDLMVKSAKVNAAGGFELGGGALKSRGPGFTLTADSAGAITSRFVSTDTGWAVLPRGRATVTAKDIVIPFKGGGYGTPMLDKASLKADIVLANLALVSKKANAPSTPIEVSNFAAAATLTPNTAPNLTLNSTLAFEGQPFSLAGAFELRGLMSSSTNGDVAVTPAKARPVGSLELTNIPTSLMKIVSAWTTDAPPQASRVAIGEQRSSNARRILLLSTSDSPQAHALGVDLLSQPITPPTTPAAPAPDLGRVVIDSVGPTIGVKLTTTAAAGDALDIMLDVNGERLASASKARLNATSFDLAESGTRLMLSPQAFDTVLAQFAPQITPRPRLADTTKVLFILSPLSVPFKEGTLSPAPARAGSVNMRLAMPNQTLVHGLTQKNADGTLKDFGDVGFEQFELNAGVPIEALLPAESKWLRPFTLTWSAIMVQGTGKPIMALKVQGTGQLTGAPAAAATLENADITTKASDIANANLENFLQMPNLLSGALGNGITLDATTTVRSFSNPQARAVELGATLNSPLLKMGEPLKFTMLSDRVRGDRPVKLTWQLQPEFANKYLFAPKPGEAQPTMKLERATSVDLNVSKFAVSIGDNSGPLKPGVFDLVLNAAVGAMDLDLPDGAKVRFNGTTVALASPQASPGTSLTFDIGVAEVGYSQGTAPTAAKRLSLKGTVSNFADDRGHVQAQQAVVTANGDMPVIPTALLDALAKQNGLLMDALGPVASATLRADHFGASGGTLDLDAKSERASAQVRGSVANGVFSSSEPVRVTLSEITSQLAGRFLKGLPLVGSVQKSKTDEPALITADQLKVPLDNDLRKLNGVVTIDPGQAKFETSKEFAGILKAISQKSTGSLGQKIDPIKATIVNGTLKYERWTLPIGEFKFRTEGTVDLVNSTVDVLTYLPLGSLSEEAAGLFKKGKGLGGLLGGKQELDQALMVPWRTRGSFGKTKTEPDLELFAKDLVKQIKPEDLLQKGLDDLLKDKIKGKK